MEMLQKSVDADLWRFRGKVIWSLLVVYSTLFLHIYTVTGPLFEPRWVAFFCAKTPLLILPGLSAASLAMRRGNETARRIFIILSILHLVAGSLYAWSYWAIWVVTTPTLLERIQATSIPAIVGIMLPAGLIYYFRKPMRPCESRSAVQEGGA